MHPGRSPLPTELLVAFALPRTAKSSSKIQVFSGWSAKCLSSAAHAETHSPAAHQQHGLVLGRAARSCNLAAVSYNIHLELAADRVEEPVDQRLRVDQVRPYTQIRNNPRQSRIALLIACRMFGL